MNATLSRWIGDADALRHLEHFRVSQARLDYGHIRSRAADYYVSLVGELFDRMRTDDGQPAEWARLGNALSQFGSDDSEILFPSVGVSRSEAILFSASAFYCGGFPASAHLTIRAHQPAGGESEAYRVCFDLLARPAVMRSQYGTNLLDALRRGDLGEIRQMADNASAGAVAALAVGPNEWIPARLLQRLMDRFVATNIRAVLPNGGDNFWTPLVASLLDRSPAAWEFFPSQIQAIQRGLLERPDTFSLQMPTGAGKTALSETLLYWHAKQAEDSVAVLLVPYRSLASELRETLVKRLNAMDISARCAYGGTVPTGDEVRDLGDARVMVATPEALSGVLSANSAFYRRISLVICDEGHLLDSVGRGVSLELLLARMRAREGGAPRLVFVSAIVPNIEEINSWLGGTADSVVRSDYRPALAEFSVLRTSGRGSSFAVDLEMHPHEPAPTRFSIAGFLKREDFQWTNAATGRRNTYAFATVKTQAIAAARKALGMGAAAVFAANKRGNQGAVGLAEELLDQLRHGLPLPEPVTFADPARLGPATQYLEREYGLEWVGTRTLRVGAVLHHGDIPQETREVIEGLLRRKDARLAICTTTLAEGVNLPIRTLVLYSVQRRRKGGRAENLLARDIKNLVGRAGRAGATTKGLVICANADQWPVVQQVARQTPGERVNGALRALVEQLQRALAVQAVPLTNERLEATPWLHTLIDGIDATLVDLAAEEIGEEALVQLAVQLADQTFASQQATQESSRRLLQRVFSLRASRVAGIRVSGRLDWIRDTGTRVRMLDAVEATLLSKRDRWDDFTDPVDPVLVNLMLEWAWPQPDLQTSIREAYRLEDNASTAPVRQPFFDLVAAWLGGNRFAEMAAAVNLPIDDMLGVHSQVVGFGLQTLIEQALAILERLVLSNGGAIAPAVMQFPEHLRFGAPTPTGRALAARGVRHRRAAVELGNALTGLVASEDRATIFPIARELMLADPEYWRDRLGELVYDNTLRDLA